MNLLYLKYIKKLEITRAKKEASLIIAINKKDSAL